MLDAKRTISVEWISRRIAFRLLLVCRADLDKVRLGGNLGLHVRVQFGRIAIWVGALCGIWANSKSFLLAPCRRAPRVSQMAPQPIASTEIRNGAPSSAGNF